MLSPANAIYNICISYSLWSPWSSWSSRRSMSIIFPTSPVVRFLLWASSSQGLPPWPRYLCHHQCIVAIICDQNTNTNDCHITLTQVTSPSSLLPQLSIKIQRYCHITQLSSSQILSFCHLAAEHDIGPGFPSGTPEHCHRFANLLLSPTKDFKLRFKKVRIASNFVQSATKDFPARIRKK